MAIPKLTDRTKTMAQTMILALARMLAMAACVLKASLSITSEAEGLNLGSDIDSDGPLKVRCMDRHPSVLHVNSHTKGLAYLVLR
jgi:hypothetical protein